jgi:DNA replication licensing factor MCM3
MAPPGLLPMSVQVVLQNKLVDTIKPGDRVQMIGIYKLIAGLNTK